MKLKQADYNYLEARELKRDAWNRETRIRDWIENDENMKMRPVQLALAAAALAQQGILKHPLLKFRE